MRYLIAIFCLVSCGKKQEALLERKVDTIIERSKVTTNKVSVMMPKIDQVIHDKQVEIIQKIEQLEAKVTHIDTSKVIYVHDTVYMKTNFWGKTKVIEKDN